ncbi:hypothetical protein QBC45DRAFT_422619 [Copromyces sp. CBS 386.78]|nr:hypothetical protein QBC45DRAFT_422619 [Copromyces sp. CBS 386.78]
MSSYYSVRKAQSYNSSGKQTGYFNNNWKQTSSTPATPPPPLGPLLKSLRVNDLGHDPDDQHSATIQDCEVVASYNWLDTNLSDPTILIPGLSPLWSPPSTPPQLREDNGTYHRDRNAARYPSHPLEPALVSYLRSSTKNTNTNTNTKPSASLIPSLVDIVACSSTLGNLLRFVRGQDKTFRILVEKVGNTVFFVRRENSPTETIPDVRGYGHAFPEAYTSWEGEVKGSSSHQRVLKYRFGGMGLLVRFEADGYVRDENETGKGSEQAGGPDKGKETEEWDVKVGSNNRIPDGLFSSLKVSSSGSTATSSSPSSYSSPTLTIKQSPNSLVPQSHVFDLKTRSIRARGVKDTLSEELPRLWISQIPRFILAYHTRGLFRTEDMEIKDVREDVKRWEKEQKEALGKLVGVLKWIREVIDDIEGGKMEVVHREEAVGVLEVREQGWPEDDETLDGRVDGNGSEEDLEVKKIDKIRGDKVMSDAIRAEWIAAQAGTDTADNQSDTRRKENMEKKKGKDITDQSDEGKHDNDYGDTDDDDYHESDSHAQPTRRYMFDVDDDAISWSSDFDRGDDRGWESDGADQDFTACSLEDCGYCGRCPY